MQLKARAVGITCEDYLNDKVAPQDSAKREMVRLMLDQNELQRFASSGEIELGDERTSELHVNQYVLLEAGEKQTIPARFGLGGKLVRLVVPEVAYPGRKSFEAPQFRAEVFY